MSFTVLPKITVTGTPPPPGAYNYAYPQVEVVIYCNEGPILTFDSNNSSILSVTTSKTLRSPQGVFEIQLAPSGPITTSQSSPEIASAIAISQQFPDYTNVISQNSLVIIRMRRVTDTGENAIYKNSQYAPATVMVGIVTGTESTLQYGNTNVEHLITISGVDFSYYLTRESYYTFSSLHIIQSESLVLASQANLTPKQAGETWLSSVMFGEHGFLSEVTFYPQTKNTCATIPLSSLYFYSFQDYAPAAGAVIPVQFTLFQSDGPWWKKFENIFIPPLYEFFVNTAPIDYYPSTSSVNASSAIPVKTPPALTSNSFPEAVPVLVARTNPNPFVWYNTNTGKWNLNNYALVSSITPNNQNMSIFDGYRGVQMYDLTKESFFSSTVGYSQNSLKNFFLFQPYLFSYNNGFSQTLMKNFIMLFGTVVDFRSFLKYGYAPAIATSFWFSDSSGVMAAVSNGGSAGFEQTYITSVSQFASYYATVPNLLNGSISMPLTPNLLVGNFVTLNPWKTGNSGSEQEYIFYITGVKHRWVMGGPSETTIAIERGLPKEIYINEEYLQDFLLNNYTRVNGQLKPVPPQEQVKSGLTYIPASQFQNMFNDIGIDFNSIISGFSTPRPNA